MNRLVSLVSICLLARVLSQADQAEALQAIKTARPAQGMAVELIASEPHLENPVAFTIDAQGRIYVVETHRHSPVGAAFRLYEGVLDIRSHMDWLPEDLALRTVEDRVKLLKRKLPQHLDSMTAQSERVRLLLDADRDGVVDASTVFADGFNELEGGIAAGVLARGENVWFASLPNLWLLRDKDRNGYADERKRVHSGFGVHIAFLGHDLHGLKIGPDGRLYFSIGDRGLHVRTREGKTLSLPDEGAVLRCELDGSYLEIFARGLRNPQELAFDQHGNLFTGDNNSDGGDRARWVYVMEGSDSGWRIGYQHLTAPPRRGPWNAERLWRPQWQGQAAYLTPPIANLGYGPSGLAFYPGTGLPAKYENHFFLADFRGGASSGIHAFTVKELGAGFEIDSYEQFVWDVLPTDVEFGPRPGLYFSDWVQGWNRTGKGRVYRVFNEQAAEGDAAVRTERLLTQGFAKLSTSDLADLLSDADQRVRQEAQLELASRGREALKALEAAALTGSDLGRLHAIWGLGQIGRRGMDVRAPLVRALGHSHPETRAQAAKTIGDAGKADIEALRGALQDSSPRVRAFAAMSLGKVARKRDALTLRTLVDLLDSNAGSDPWLRQAAVFALEKLDATAFLEALATHDSEHVKVGAVVALRRLESPKVSAFLSNASPGVVLEAARAIHDAPIPSALPKLAGLIHNRALLASFPPEPETVARPEVTAVQASLSDVAATTGWTTPAEQLFTRVINANFRLGGRENARAVAALAADKSAPNSIRVDALQALAAWDNPSSIDRVLGLWRPLSGKRAIAREALAPMIGELLLDSGVAPAAITAAERARLTEALPGLEALVRSEKLPGSLRAAALEAMRALKAASIEAVLQFALGSADSDLKAQALKIDMTLNPDRAFIRLVENLRSPDIRAQQQAFAGLAAVPNPQAERLLAEAMEQLLEGKVRKEVQLDILDAANKRGSPRLLELARAYEQARSREFVAAYPELLHGGNAEAGKKLFFERAEFSCSRCHAKDGEGGQAGPDLTGLGSRKPRDYILESIYFPNASIAEGWENVVVYTHNGPSYAGVVKSENDESLTIDSPEDGIVTLDKSRIHSRDRSLSAMPEEFRQMLTRPEARDLIEFLAK